MLALLLAATLATCECPHSKPLFRTDDGLLVCGLPDGKRFSEVELIDCNSGAQLLSIGAVHEVEIEKRKDGHVRVVQLSEWPFGEHWKWTYVPVLEYDVTGHQRGPLQPKVVIPRPAATADEKRQFMNEYLALLAKPERPAVDDRVVGKLFALAIDGDPKARALFDAMKRDTQLDGASLETWELAAEQLAMMPR